MRLLDKSKSYSLASNSDYFCIVGPTVRVYRNSDLSLVCKFTESRSCNYAQFAGDHLLVTKAPTLSNLTYRVYDIQRKACIKEIIIPNKVAQDAKFIISPDHKYVYDVIDVVPLKNIQLCKINIESGVCEWVRLGDNVRVIETISYNETTDCVLISHSHGVGERDGELKGVRIVTEVDTKAMTCKDIYKRYTPISNGSIFMFDNRYILFENMEFVDITTGEVAGKINYPYERMKYGYFRKAYFLKDHDYLAFVFSKRVILFDYVHQQVYKEYPENYCSCVDIVGNRVIIGTWDKVLVDDL